MTILLAWILADFISGIVHWYEDKILVGFQRNRFLDQIRKDNELHHEKPGAMLQLSAFQNIETSLIAIPIAFALWVFGAPDVVSLAVFFSTFGNLIHRWTHQRRLIWPIRALKMIGLFQSKDHHWAHHHDAHGSMKSFVIRPNKKEEATERYCVMTDWLNPILDRVGFWDILEKAAKR